MKLCNEMLEINKKGHYSFGGVDTVELAETYGTPLYVISEEKIRQNLREFHRAFSSYFGSYRIIYASKALCTKAICRIVSDEGAGVDVVSVGEMLTALASGVKPQSIYFHGNNKSNEELKFALSKGVKIVLDNDYELSILESIAKSLKDKVPILVRIKPEVFAKTHAYIQTGHPESKFGVEIHNLDIFNRIKSLPFLKFEGIHFHIGSQILDTGDYYEATKKAMEFIHRLKSELNLEVKELDVGGGFGIKYTDEDHVPPAYEFASKISEAVNETSQSLNIKKPKVMTIEPGRAIVGNAGVTIYEVGAIKKLSSGKNYLFVDGGMGDNIRPSLYQAVYTACVAEKPTNEPVVTYAVAGKYCESGDILIKEALLPEVEPKEHLVVLDTGAYCYSMASNYNRFSRPAMVLVNNGKSSLIVKRETYEQIMQNDVVPEWLKGGN